ncbi:Uncharacterised protein [Escherichia coli]|uniref:Uncharacterized protein n=1 Tax=Escherichia coli TaxID=562 RepID=A0A376L6L3_ECOLX|nr:Uncharacterised protein [Escherichia coli]
MLSGLLIKIIRFLFFHFTSPPPLVYLMLYPHNHIIALHYFNN